MNTLRFRSYPDYRALSAAVCDSMLALMRQKPDATLCLATGATPLLVYQQLVEKIKQQAVDVSQITFVKLDEWAGISSDNPGSCEHFLQRHIIQPLHIQNERFISFDPAHANPQECRRIEALIAGNGGLDFCLLGLGKNGHLGLNEPNAALTPGCHIAQLDEQTRQHEMLKNADQPITQGITLGLRNILAAKTVFLLVAGEGKQGAFTALCEENVTTALPASFLWLHPNATCFYDEAHYVR
ncbi:galactosamine-6-phosphate isomerase [Pluralibacter sp.]|uniref:galactosamine-6-phosphate isomerase n=1 Tax=Pluralibacter sp. TaxID=1920032 RepID=UPI0025E72404|nr:galactosamine-6-phosphate isomerase [Pluralibacter sp.]MBV8042305.1 galactosamine-6-phosphate isomerase [Pluralibacter sp.]